MKILKLQENKVRQLIRRHGVDYQVIRPKVDQFKQTLRDNNGNPLADSVRTVKGVFHESGSHLASYIMTATPGAQMHKKPTTAILAMWDSIGGVAVNDQLTVPPGSDIWYRITAINDMGNLRLFADISLEVREDGLPV